MNNAVGSNDDNSQNISFFIDGQAVEAVPDEAIWSVAKRHHINIPHLCHLPKTGYRADGNCRVCMVSIEGERVLAASCNRKPTPGMKVSTQGESEQKARRLVMELLIADQPQRKNAHDQNASLWQWAESMNLQNSRFPTKPPSLANVPADLSHSAIAVNLDACIQCQLCVQACRDIQVNDVIGMAGRGAHSKVVFDMDDPLGQSTCVACGECVQVCPTGALMPKAVVNEQGVGSSQADRTVDSVCPYCGVGCLLTYHIKDDKLHHVEGRDGPANQNRLCVKGRFGFDYITHPHRLKTPLIRKNGVSKTDLDKLDPANPFTHFRAAGWEEALKLAAGGLKLIRDKKGGQALAGFGSAKCSNEEAYLFQKLVRTGFGSNNVDHCTRLCHASSVAALLETIGSSAVTADFNEAINSELIIIIGCNPTQNHPVAATFIKNAAKQGAHLVIMDPRGQTLKNYASDILQTRPGSDVALLNGMLNVIVSEQLQDQAYIEAHTEGFAAFAEHIKAFTPEKMSPICGIAAKVIRNIARRYATAKSALIFWGMGISQHVHGTDNARCLISLALMCGHIGKPGSGLHPLRGQNNVQGASDAGLIPMMYPDYMRVDLASVQAKFTELWGAELNPQPGLTVVEIMDAIHQGEIEGMYIMGENPAMSDPDLEHVKAALAKLQHLVVQDLFLTETAMYADVILPASAWPEKDGTVTNTNRQIQMGRQALPVPGEAKPDWWICQEIAKGLDLDWRYQHPKDIYQEMESAMPSLANISWQRLEREDSVTYPCTGPDQPGQGVIFADGFPTSSRRGKFVAADIIPPAEQPDTDFPFILITGRQLEHWHTGAMTRRSQVLDELEPTAIASLCQKDLEKLAIKPGDLLQVSTRRGSIKLPVRVDEDMAEGQLFIPFCYVEAAANVLTNPALDPVGKIPEFKFSAAKLEPCKQHVSP